MHTCSYCDGSMDVEEEAEQEIEEVVVEQPFAQSVVNHGIEISVSAPAGVFPAEAFLRVQMITNQADVTEIEQLVTEKKDENTTEDVETVVEESYSRNFTPVPNSMKPTACP